MTTMASQFTSLTVIYSTVYSDADKKKTSKLRDTGLCVGSSPGPVNSHKGHSYVENVSIWWRHHGEDWCGIWKKIELLTGWTSCEFSLLQQIEFIAYPDKHKVFNEYDFCETASYSPLT